VLCVNSGPLCARNQHRTGCVRAAARLRAGQTKFYSRVGPSGSNCGKLDGARLSRPNLSANLRDPVKREDFVQASHLNLAVHPDAR
jgi:hypothetical protein